MKRILLIIPYFGKFPEYFPMWLKSVEFNSTINFLIITDNQIERCPDNVRIIKSTFEETASYIQSKFSFKISLLRPYELTKFKPAYGFVFSEYITDFDFWGYCDVDLIFGNLRTFITDEILESQDKVFSHGHLTLYRNCDAMNRLFMTKRRDCFYYKDVFKSDGIWNNFDEYPYGIARIARQEKVKVYEKLIFADLDMFFFTFRKVASYFTDAEDDSEEIAQYFVWDYGKLTDVMLLDAVIESTEVAYVHFQKRNMNCKSVDDIEQVFAIVPNEFIPDKEYHFDRMNRDAILSKNREYCEAIVQRRRNQKKVPLFEKVFSFQRLKRKAFLFKMNKIYGVKPYHFSKGGF